MCIDIIVKYSLLELELRPSKAIGVVLSRGDEKRAIFTGQRDLKN